MILGVGITLGVLVTVAVAWLVTRSGSGDRSYEAVAKVVEFSGVRHRALQCTPLDRKAQVYEVRTTEGEPRRWRVDLMQNTAIEV